MLFRSQQAARPAARAKSVRQPKPHPQRDIFEQEAEAWLKHQKEMEAKRNRTPQQRQLDDLIEQVKARKAAGEKRITFQQGGNTENLTVTQLIKKLEDMRKKL